jgi:ribosome biogenesis GTPase
VKFTGIIIKGYSGFYYVLEESMNQAEQSPAEKKIWECSLRGKLRLKEQAFFPGDRVVCTKVNKQKGQAVLEEVLPRRTELSRPSVANVEQVVIITALAEPEPDLQLLDRIIIMAVHQGVSPLLCFNKADLVSAQQVEELIKKYAPTGYPLVVSSAIKNWGIEELKTFLQHKVSVLAGPSGVGKTSLLNSLEKRFSLPIGEISKKAGRGRHTTRHVELLPLSCGGLLADTPGFSRLHLSREMRKEDLSRYYPDFWSYQVSCKFKTCLHREEPSCSVRRAVEQGLLDVGRYERYLKILAEIIVAERSY